MNDRRPVLIEQTSKRWKALQIAGALMIAASVATFVLRLPSDAANLAALVALIGGIAIFALGRLGAFWYHG